MQQFRRAVGMVAATAVFGLSAHAQCPQGSDSINRREPGSLLLFPEFDNSMGRVTVITVTNTKCNEANADIQVEFKYINGDSCLEANEQEDLTPCDTVTLLTTAHTGINRGYLYVFARDPGNTSSANPSGNPVTFNHLIGQLLVVDGFTSFEYSVNAVSFKGLTKEYETTDIDSPGLFDQINGQIGDGIRDLDGNEYTQAPDRIYIPRYLGQDPVQAGGGIHSELILIALSGGRLFQSNQAIPGGGTTAFFEGYNDNEQPFSVEHTFDCWQKLRLGYLQTGDPDGMPPSPGTMAFDESVLAAGFTNDPNEIRMPDGMGGFTEWRNAGWFRVYGSFASSSAETIVDPAIYAVLIESIRNHASADLPFEYCSQDNGDLLPNNILGDWNPGFDPGGNGPFFFNNDNQ